MMAKRYGTVLVFKEGVDKERIHRALRALSFKGILDPEVDKDVIEDKALIRFDPKFGSPVWYIP